MNNLSKSLLLVTLIVECVETTPVYAAATPHARRTIFDRYRSVKPNLTYAYVTAYGNTPNLRARHTLFLGMFTRLVASTTRSYRPALRTITEI